MNYIELRAAIQNYSQDFEASFTENIDTFIRLSESRISLNVRLPNFRKDIPGQLTAGDNLWPVPTDFLAPDSVIITTPWGMWLPLNKDIEFVEECYPDPNLRGYPRFYAYMNAQWLKFGPTPDANYDFKLGYFTAQPSIVDAKRTYLGDNFSHALLSGSLVEACKYQKGEQELYSRLDQAFKEDLSMDLAYAKGRARKDTQEEADKRVQL